MSASLPFLGPGMNLCDFAPEAGKLLPWMMAQLAVDTNSAKIPILVPAIARQGLAAKAAIPVLLELLHKPETKEVDKITLRIALANLGHRTAELLARISSDLDNTNGAPYNSAQMQTLRALGYAQANDWIAPTVCTQLTRMLPNMKDTSTFALIALGAAGTNAQTALPELIRVKRAYVGPEFYGLHAWLNMAAYRMDPAHPRAYLQETLSILSTNFNHTDGILCLLAGSVFYDDNLLNELLELGKNWHSPTGRLAMGFLAYIGRPASAIVPHLLDCAQNSPDEDQRRDAICILGCIADPAAVDKLQALLEKEESDTVKKALQGSIGMLRHEIRE